MGETPKRMGRPTSLTDEVRTIILAALLDGSRRGAAAQLAGIHPNTLSTWMTAEGEPWESFQAQVLEVEAKAEQEAVDIIRRAAKKTPQWAAWWLERRHPDGWAPRRESGGKEGPEEPAAPFDPKTLSDEELELAARGEPPPKPPGAGRR